jgi:threonine dehydrogenase-like Zn-dependent dehydrogenase
MKAAIFGGPNDITVGERPDPVIQAPTDAIVRVTLACVCGSDLSTDVVAERGEAAIEAVKAMTDGLGVEAALECVGTGESMATRRPAGDRRTGSPRHRDVELRGATEPM